MKKDFLKSQLLLISPSEEETILLKEKTKNILDNLRDKIKKQKISAEVFVGGSFAKDTMIKKSKYDVDIFVRFDFFKYKEKDISKLLEKIVPKNSKRIHGSRDYFSVSEENIEFELIPVLKIKKPELAVNITDLSYFHVNYVLGKIKKNRKLSEEIRIAKAFVHYSGCYGAESYINGFSGYALELLISSYGSFMKFISVIAKHDIKKGKIIIDPANFFRNKLDITRQLNESKLHSPIILVDPTFKERNALAALSNDTFYKFQDYCRRFLKNPAPIFFEQKDMEADIKRKYKDLVEIELVTDKQEGDIAGTKLKKFASFFIKELERYFEVKAFEFVYDNKKTGKILIAAEAKKEIEFPGPPLEMKEPLARFKKEHKNIKVVKGRAFAYEKNNFDIKSFLDFFKNSKSNIIQEMDVSELKLL
jgi:tRNA CCA-adding enzyme